ncbi:DUF3871 family protein [Aquirufa aurantiipilula]|uniref:DUF3871 family protein n=1 Tax=Aquirufa aurantiipilula TaxID=2696561 RepID=UPI001CAA7F24|nr:DUF3871 family protein [Aquirufa aurantiipilula]MBZ1326547.1 DUF3871 family protein [Aquirufa aurantiipilula]
MLTDNIIQEIATEQVTSSSKCFIGANTIEASLAEIQHNHIVPSYTKDLEPLISIGDFVQSTYDVVKHYLEGEEILAPSILLSHPIKGRIPEARHKQASELLEHEKTIFYERAMFVIDIPSITQEIDGQPMHLSIGGVKSYSEDNFNAKKGALESFKLFVGFQVKVCNNMCIWTDGTKLGVKVRSIGELMDTTMEMLNNYNPQEHIEQLNSFTNYYLTEKQFALMLGRARLYNFLPYALKKQIPPLLYTDTQISNVAKDYFQDKSFCRNEQGDISLWKVFNLLTNSNKASYIDQFLGRAVNAYDFTQQIANAVQGKQESWYLS